MNDIDFKDGINGNISLQNKVVKKEDKISNENEHNEKDNNVEL
jgi:hypothetical protein